MVGVGRKLGRRPPTTIFGREAHRIVLPPPRFFWLPTHLAETSRSTPARREPAGFLAFTICGQW